MGKTSPVVALDPVTQNNLDTYRLIVADLKRLQSLEMQYRLALINQLPIDHSQTEGTQSVKLPSGERLSATAVMNYSVAKDRATVEAAVKALYERSPEAAISVISWEPKLSVSAYKKLTEEQRQIIAPIVTSKPGTPQFEIVPAQVQKA